MEERKEPTILERLNYLFGTGSSDFSEVRPEEIVEYTKENPIKIL